MNWVQKNFKKIIYIAFLVPILTVAGVSISHVTSWYGLSNPLSWSIYLSVGIEIAALSALAAISAQMGKKVYFPFGIVTLIQFIGNIFFAYQYINVDSQAFKDWVDLVDPIVSYLGVESGDPIGHKRFLALFAGGMLPIISLSFLHMLVKFEEDEKKNGNGLPQPVINIDELSIEAGKKEAEIEKEIEKEKYTPTEEQLDILEKIILGKYDGPEEVINETKPINPTQEELDILETELRRVNEQKFGTLEGPTGSNGPDDSGLQEIQINEPEKKVLNYLRRDA
jgi:hypothetical protein